MAYKHQAVSDLAWIFNAPMIVADIDLSQWWIEELETLLSELDRDPHVLLDCIDQCKSHFLGAYFEVLFSFAIREFSTLIIVFEHEQLADENGKTLGEIDMLVKTSEGRFFQFEIAIKYFLEVKQHSDIEWIGPNKTDSLSKKSTKARAKQLTILNTDLGRSFLEKWEIKQAVEPKLLIFGYLFSQGRKNESLTSDSFNENAHWLRLNEFKNKKLTHFSFYELVKPKWITSNDIQRDEILSYESVCLELERSFESDIRPKMYYVWSHRSETVVHTNETLQKNQWERVFVVPNDW